MVFSIVPSRVTGKGRETSMLLISKSKMDHNCYSLSILGYVCGGEKTCHYSKEIERIQPSLFVASEKTKKWKRDLKARNKATTSVRDHSSVESRKHILAPQDWEFKSRNEIVSLHMKHMKMNASMLAP
jgi:hypothetical protein